MSCAPVEGTTSSTGRRGTISSGLAKAGMWSSVVEDGTLSKEGPDPTGCSRSTIGEERSWSAGMG